MSTVIGGALDSHGNDVPSAGASRTRRRRSSAISAARTARAAARRRSWTSSTSTCTPTRRRCRRACRTTGTTIAEGDYAKLVALLGKAFDGTAQTGLDAADLLRRVRRRDARSRPQGGAVLRRGGGRRPSTRRRRRSYYAEAFRLALCQPNVIGIMVFHVDRRERARSLAVGRVLRRRDAEVVTSPAIRDAASARCARAAAPRVPRPHRAPHVAVSTSERRSSLLPRPTTSASARSALLRERRAHGRALRSTVRLHAGSRAKAGRYAARRARGRRGRERRP